MNFFKSILSDDPDPDPSLPQNPQEQQSHETPVKDTAVDPDHSSKPDSGSVSTTANDGDIWSFGGIFKTIATRSESVLETYRKDLEEFGSGLKKETELFREVASRAVKDLPNSIEVIDGVIKSTAEIISQGKDTLLASSDVDPETPDTNRILNSGRYSWFESQLISIQNDPNTFCVEPEDLEEYKKWKLEFDLKEKSEEVDNLFEKNESLEVLYKRVVPSEVDDETFWCRYFYRLYKLKQQESVRAKIVKRAISVGDDDEELSWDVDDDDDDNEQGKEGSVNDVNKSAPNENESGTKGSSSIAKEVSSNKTEPRQQDSTDVIKQASHSDESQTLSSAAVDKKEESQSNVDSAGTSDVVESRGNSNDTKKEESEVTKKEEGVVTGSEEKGNNDKSDKANGAGKSDVVEPKENNIDSKKEDSEVTNKEKGVVIGSEGKGDKDKSGKDGDVSTVSNQKADEEDLDWAEIEDIEDNEDKKATSRVASSNRADLKKRLSVEEDDEDLSWDIEDDD